MRLFSHFAKPLATRALLAGAVLAGTALAVPAADAQSFSVGVQFGRPAYGYVAPTPFGYGYDRHLAWERHEAWVRHQRFLEAQRWHAWHSFGPRPYGYRY